MARLIVEVFGRAWLMEFHSAKVTEDDDCEEDSHITVGSGSFDRADDEEADEADQRKFGFG